MTGDTALPLHVFPFAALHITSESLVVQVNARWCVVVVSDRVAWRRRAWMLQQLVDDAWQDRAAVRTSETLRGLVKAHAGRVNAGVPAILAELPERADLRVGEDNDR
jgi:hypothetical protein